jgi:hypothetical protein
MKISTKLFYSKWYLLFSLALFSILSCQKDVQQLPDQEEFVSAATSSNEQGHLKQTKTFSSAVVINWYNMQLEMLRVPLATGARSQAADRVLAYNGIALYESVLPGMPAHRSMSSQLTDFPVMPGTESGKAYHWAASANAALAYMNRKLFPDASAANKTAMDVLENALQAQYAGEVDATTLQRSINFGREVATLVSNWAATDGSANVNPAYVPPVGPGLWVPNSPTSAPVGPYYNQRRLLVPGVSNGTAIAPPPAYSTDPASPFFAMVKDVYDKSLVLTPDQTAMAIYHRDAPGYPGGGHFVAVLSQVLAQAGVDLADAALACVKTGIGYHDAVLLCFTKKYTVNLVRPITYIRNVMGYTTWNPLIPTPNHPEFPSAHAVNSAAVAEMLTSVFGDHFSFTLDTYHYLGLPARNYASFEAMSIEMSNSRVFGGIHYQATCDKSRWMGEKVGQYVLGKIRFKND